MKPYIRKIMPFIVLQIIADFICTLLASMYPLLQKQLFDSQHRFTVIVWYAIFHLLDVIINYWGLRATWAGAVRLEKNLKSDFFKTILHLKKKEFVSRDIGTYLSWQNNDLSALEQDYLQPVIDVIRSVNMFLIYGIVIFGLVDWRIGTVIFVSSILTVAGPKLLGDKLAGARNIYQESIAEYISRVKDLLEGFSLINSRTRDRYQITQEETLDKMCKKRTSYGKAKSLSIGMNDMSVRLIQIASFAAAGILFATGRITVGTCVATFGYVESFLSPINSILYDVSAIQSVSAVRKKILAFMAKDSEEKRPVCNLLEKEINLSNISVQYDMFSMKQLSCRFEKGKKYALIGHSGSGKTTLLNLLTGDLEPQEGIITVDGRPIKEQDTAGLISCIHQDEHIFQTGYLDNITVFGAYSDKQLQELRGSLQNQVLDTVLGNASERNCQELSGGERQTIAFLRVLLENTQVILMDEPFSAVDVRTKDIYLNYMLHNIRTENILIMVTHDLSDRLSDFDEIYVISEGRIAARGNYEEVKKSQAYQNLASNPI